MKCFRCEASMASGATLFRVNEKGIPGVWACHAHRTKYDPELDQIVKVIEDANPDLGINGSRCGTHGTSGS